MAPDRAALHPDTASTITIAFDAASVTTAHASPSGYAVFIDHAPYAAAISEPLPPTLVHHPQSAHVHALLSALELAHALRPRRARLVSHSQYAVHAYNHHMAAWRDGGWRRGDGSALADVGLWKSIVEYPASFRRRAMRVHVVWEERPSTAELVEAHSLARHACSLNHYCTVCCAYIGRVGTAHRCTPVCNTGKCNFRQFVHIDAYNSHVAAVHAINRPCRRSDCALVFGSEKAALQHEHMVHDGYVYECEYCDDVFQSDDDRDEHEEDECDYSPYCRICDRWFGSFHAWSQHDEAVH